MSPAAAQGPCSLFYTREGQIPGKLDEPSKAHACDDALNSRRRDSKIHLCTLYSPYNLHAQGPQLLTPVGGCHLHPQLDLFSVAPMNAAQATCRKPGCQPTSDARPGRVLRFFLHLGFKMLSIVWLHNFSSLHVTMLLSCGSCF